MAECVRAALLASVPCNEARELGQAICDALATPDTVLARIWISEPEGLRLLASAGAPLGGGAYRRTDGAFSRLPLGVGKIGIAAASGEPFVVRQIRGDEDWLANPGWIARQNVRSFVACPLVAGDAVLGVLALFDRVTRTDCDLDELLFLARFVAARLQAIQWPAAAAQGAEDIAQPPRIVTRRELRDAEKRSIEAALSQTNGKIFGVDGAAALLGMKPTTLASRIRALGIR